MTLTAWLWVWLVLSVGAMIGVLFRKLVEWWLSGRRG